MCDYVASRLIDNKNNKSVRTLNGNENKFDNQS